MARPPVARAGPAPLATVLALVVALTAACSAGTATTGTGTAGPGTTGTTPVGTADAAAPPADPAPEPACPAPTAPLAYAGPEEELPAVAGDVISVPVEVGGERGFDSDGDGVEDTVTDGPGGGVTVTRGDGDVVLDADRSFGTYGVGDIDGDGRDELVVAATPPRASEPVVYLVPGTVAPGTTPVDAAGIAVSDAASGIEVAVAVRFDGHRLALVDPYGRTRLLDTLAVLALGPGGDARDLPSTELPGSLAATVPLGGPDDDLVLLGHVDGDVGVRIVGTEAAALTTAPHPGDGRVEPSGGRVAVTATPDGDLVVRLDRPSRFGSESWLWSLGAPCAT